MDRVSRGEGKQTCTTAGTKWPEGSRVAAEGGDGTTAGLVSVDLLAENMGALTDAVQRGGVPLLGLRSCSTAYYNQRWTRLSFRATGVFTPNKMPNPTPYRGRRGGPEATVRPFRAHHGRPGCRAGHRALPKTARERKTGLSSTRKFPYTHRRADPTTAAGNYEEATAKARKIVPLDEPSLRGRAQEAAGGKAIEPRCQLGIGHLHLPPRGGGLGTPQSRRCSDAGPTGPGGWGRSTPRSPGMLPGPARWSGGGSPGPRRAKGRGHLRRVEPVFFRGQGWAVPFRLSEDPTCGCCHATPRVSRRGHGQN